MKKFLASVSLLVAAIALSAVTAFAGTGVLVWTANTETDLAGYKVYQSTVSGVYGTPIATLGKVMTYTATLPQLTTSQVYYWTITAYDLAGNESPKSAQVSKLIPAFDFPPTAPVGITVQ